MADPKPDAYLSAERLELTANERVLAQIINDRELALAPVAQGQSNRGAIIAMGTYLAGGASADLLTLAAFHVSALAGIVAGAREEGEDLGLAMGGYLAKVFAAVGNGELERPVAVTFEGGDGNE